MVFFWGQSSGVLVIVPAFINPFTVKQQLFLCLLLVQNVPKWHISIITPGCAWNKLLAGIYVIVLQLQIQKFFSSNVGKELHCKGVQRKNSEQTRSEHFHTSQKQRSHTRSYDPVCLYDPEPSWPPVLVCDVTTHDVCKTANTSSAQIVLFSIWLELTMNTHFCRAVVPL